MTNKIYIKSGTTTNNISIDENAAEKYNTTARAWASKMDGKVEGIDYSSKYYANEAKNSAETAETTKNIAITEIQNRSSLQISAIESKGQEQLDNLGNLATTALSNLTSNGESHFDNRFVKKNGDTMSGVLKIKKNAEMDFINLDITNVKGAVQENIGQIAFSVDNINTAILRATRLTSGTNSLQLFIRQNDSNKGGLTIGCDAEGTVWTQAVTPSLSKNNTDIATTAWVKSLIKSYITQTYRNGTSWYRVYSDGWCEQGGYNAKSGLSDVTFLKTYTSTPSVICTTHSPTASDVYGVNIRNVELDKFTYYIHAAYTGIYWQSCGYIK